MRRKFVIITILVVTLSIVALTIYMNFDNMADEPSTKITTPSYRAFLNRMLNLVDNADEGEDFLVAVLGSDEREKEISRSDVIMLIKYKADENKVIVVSVPRDCKVSIPGKGRNKINAAYAFGGPKLQVKVLEELFNIEDVRYIHMNFEDFKSIVDALGGIKINAEKDFKNGDEVFARKGDNVLMGEDLLAYVRYRKDINGDFGRIKRQQEVISSLADSILNPDNASRLPKLALLIANNSDSDMDIFFIMSHINELENLDSLKFEFYTLKTTSDKSNGIWYEIIDEKHLQLISDLLQS